MIKNSLRTFVDTVLDNKAITSDDVCRLRREVLADGILCREEADVLIALDRAVPQAGQDFRDFVVASVVDFAVWTSRPTGYVDRDTARWLATSLSCGSGPTPTALRIGFEVVKEAQQVDEALLAFVLRGQQRGAAGVASAQMAA
jgi:hypothetical protein